MCSQVINNSDDGSLCEIIILKENSHSAPLIAFLPESQNIRSIFLLSLLLQFFVVMFPVFFSFFVFFGFSFSLFFFGGGGGGVCVFH